MAAAAIVLSPDVRLLRAPNPGPMTLDGTNTWLLGDPDRGAVLVVDPGPLHQPHLDLVLQACRGEVAEIVLTHRHDDHSAGAEALARAAGCGIRSADPRWGRYGPPLADLDQFEVAGVTVQAYATPGHTRDSFSLLVKGQDGQTRLATGDMVLGRGTTVIAHPDGKLADYLASLSRLQELVGGERVSELLPGHGPVVTEPQSWLSDYRRHRLQRLEEVRTAVAAGARTAAEVVARVYGDIDPAVRPAAERSVAAQLEYLSSSGPSPAGPSSLRPEA